MAQQVRFRRQASLALNAFGTKFIQPLGRGMLYRELVLELSGTITYAAAASNAVAVTARGDEWSMLTSIQIIANGTDVIRSFTGLQLRWLNRYLYNSIPRGSAQWGDGVSASPVVDSTLIIPFWQPLSVKPMDTVFDSSAVSDFRIEVITNTAAGITTGTAPTAIALTLDVGSNESFGVSGEFSDCRIYNLAVLASGANTQLQIQLPVGPLYRGFIINTSTTTAETSLDIASTAAVPPTTGVSNLKLISGTNVFRDMPWSMLLDWQTQRLGWDRQRIQNVAATSPMTGGYVDTARNVKNLDNATVFMDLVQDGLLTEALDSLGFSELYLELNVKAACAITVLPIQIYPRRKAA